MSGKWSPEDITRWVEKIKKEELDFADQVRMVQFLKDLQDSYVELAESNKRNVNRLVELHGRLKSLSTPLTALINLAAMMESVDDGNLRAALKYWTDTLLIELDLLRGAGAVDA